MTYVPVTPSPRHGHRYTTDTLTLLWHVPKHHYRLHVLVSLYTIHGHACTLGTVISYRHLIHLTFLLHVLVTIGYTNTLHMYFIYLCHRYTGNLYCYMYLSHELFVYMLWLFLYFCSMNYNSCYITDCYIRILVFLLHYCLRMFVPDIDIDIIILLLGHTGNWSKMCGAKYHP